jgi:hypothetical protein
MHVREEHARAAARGKAPAAAAPSQGPVKRFIKGVARRLLPRR